MVQFSNVSNHIMFGKVESNHILFGEGWGGEFMDRQEEFFTIRYAKWSMSKICKRKQLSNPGKKLWSLL